MLKQDHDLSKGVFHTAVVKSFIHALIAEMKGAFDISNLPVLKAFQKLESRGLPDRDSLSFESYREEELKYYMISMVNKYIRGKNGASSHTL